jgi:hypothetical protein
MVGWNQPSITHTGPDAPNPNDPARPVLGRVLKVYLADPSVTDAPVETDFTLGRIGVHVGLEHGNSVWISYMPPPPKFTAVQWSSSITYQKDDVVYSYTSGEVYRSKATGNIGHDPVSTSSGPSDDTTVDRELIVPPPTTEITQTFVPTNLGLASRNEIMEINLLGLSSPPDPSDPPPSGATWVISVIVEGGSLGSAVHIANGTDTLAVVATDLKTQLDALTGITATVNTTTFVITCSAAFWFGLDQQTYQPSGQPAKLLRSVITQTYSPAIPLAAGLPQVTQTTITPQTTYPGGKYSLVVIDSLGVEHAVEYESMVYDDSIQIMQGIINAAQAETDDDFWETVQFTFDPTGITLDLSMNDSGAVMFRTQQTGGAWWELVPFPKALADAVMRGAVADLNREWGQSDKAAAEEQVVPQETDIASTNFTAMPVLPLTSQQTQRSRYRIT